MSSLEKIFIEKRIYRDIENSETWESVISTIDKGLTPYKKKLLREVTREDIIQLTEIKIKRISKFDIKKADEHIKGLEEELEEVKNHLNNIIPYTINYFKQIKKKYGKGKERKTEIRSFDTIEATKVVANNAKMYANFKEGFIGTGLKKDEFICDCSDIDDILIIRKDGVYKIVKVDDKIFVGNDILHVGVFLKNDERTIYNVVYQDGKDGNLMAKRCAISGLTRDKEYNLTKGSPGSKIVYMSVNPNGEAEVIRVHHKPKARLKKLVFEFDFGSMAIKGKSSMGNILTRNPVHKVALKEKGLSTLGGRKIWFDDAVFRLNVDGRGNYLGEFSADDKILVITKNGFFRITGFDLSNHFEDNILIIEKISGIFLPAFCSIRKSRSMNVQPSNVASFLAAVVLPLPIKPTRYIFLSGIRAQASSGLGLHQQEDDRAHHHRPVMSWTQTCFCKRSDLFQVAEIIINALRAN
jgi:topoisomerase-4 subunit A